MANAACVVELGSTRFTWAAVTLFLRAETMIILGSSIAAKLFTCYSHTHFTLSASGLRLEISWTTDKEISEVYFVGRAKKILTVILNRQVPGTSNQTAYAEVDQIVAVAQLRGERTLRGSSRHTR